MVYLVDERHESLTNLRLPVESVDSCENRVLPAGCETISTFTKENTSSTRGINHEFSNSFNSQKVPSPSKSEDLHTSYELDESKIQKLTEKYADHFSSIISRSKAQSQKDEYTDSEVQRNEDSSTVQESENNSDSLSGNTLSFDFPSSENTSEGDDDSDEVTPHESNEGSFINHDETSTKDSHKSSNDESESSAHDEVNSRQLPSDSPVQHDILEDDSDSASFEKYESTRSDLLKRIEATTEQISGGKSILCQTSGRSTGSSHQSPRPEIFANTRKVSSESRDDDALHFQNKVLREEVLRLKSELQYAKKKGTPKEVPKPNEDMIPILTKQLMSTKQKLLKEQSTLNKLMQKMSLQRKKSEEKVEKLSNHILYLESLLRNHGIPYNRVSTNYARESSDVRDTPVARNTKNRQSLFSDHDDNEVRSTVSDMTDSVKDIGLNPMNVADLSAERLLIDKTRKPKETMLEKIRRKYLCQDIDNVSDGGSLDGDKNFYQPLQ